MAWLSGAACSGDEPGTATETLRDGGAGRDAATEMIDAGRPPRPPIFDAGRDDGSAPFPPIAVRCGDEGPEPALGLEWIARDRELGAFTAAPSGELIFAIRGGALHRVEDGALEPFAGALTDVDALQLDGDELFVAISREGEPLVIAKLDASTAAREDLASDAELGEARGLALDGEHVYWAADTTADPPGGHVYRVPRMGGASELLSELPIMFLPEGAAIARDSLRVGAGDLGYIAQAGESTACFRAPKDRRADPSLISSLSAAAGLPSAGFLTDIGLELDDDATYLAASRNAAWLGAQGIVRVASGELHGEPMFDTGEQRPLGLTSDADYVYWMMENRQGTVSLFRGRKDGTAPEAIATGFHWTRGFSASGEHVYFIVDDCPGDGDRSLVRIDKR